MTVKDIPIIFSAPMVRALLDGRKAMTRRLAWRSETDKRKMSFVCDGERPNPLARKAKGFGVQMGGEYWLQPTHWVGARPGDRLWVRETWRHNPGGAIYNAAGGQEDYIDDEIVYAADWTVPRKGVTWRSPIHCPRSASRLTLTVTATKIERLQDISAEDADAEGIVYEHADPPFTYVPGIMPHSITACGIEEMRFGPMEVVSFSRLWRHLHGPGSWDANPEVVALTFTVHKQNIDTLPKAEAA